MGWMIYDQEFTGRVDGGCDLDDSKLQSVCCLGSFQKQDERGGMYKRNNRSCTDRMI